MAKQRRKTNAKVPAKGRLREMADQLWSLAVKSDWNHTCAICGSKGDLNSHHLIPRQHYAMRYELRNGICLCRRCHQFCPDHSPHQNAIGFVHWLWREQNPLYQWHTETVASGAHKEFTDTKNAAFFCAVIQELKQYVEPEDFTRIVGVRFAAWLNEQEK